jgi:hypothetical protein
MVPPDLNIHVYTGMKVKWDTVIKVNINGPSFTEFLPILIFVKDTESEVFCCSHLIERFMTTTLLVVTGILV